MTDCSYHAASELTRVRLPNPARQPRSTTALLQRQDPRDRGRDPSYHSMVLFDMEQTTQALERGWPPPTLGFISTHPPEQMYCGDVWMVGVAVSVRGWGPLLYDLLLGWAASKNLSIMASRTSIQPSARAVWRFYWENRPDVRQVPLRQDCEMYPDEHWLDRGYVAQDSLLFNELSDRGEGYLAALHDGLLVPAGKGTDTEKIRTEFLSEGLRMFTGWMDDRFSSGELLVADPGGEETLEDVVLSALR